MKQLYHDPRTKLFLILLCVLSAMFAPNLYFQFALVAVIGLLAALCGKWQYALRGMIAYALICVFTVWCMAMAVLCVLITTTALLVFNRVVGKQQKGA